MLNRIAIIGDTGLIGSHLKKELNTSHLFNSSNIDLFDPYVVDTIDNEINTIIFLAGDPRMFYFVDKPAKCFRNNYELIKNILKKKQTRFVFLSTVCVYRDIHIFSKSKILGWNPVSTFYGISKLMAEYELKLNIKDYCILRLSTPFGKGMRKGPLFDILSNNETYVNLNSKYSFLHLDDIISAIKHVIENNISGCFNLTYKKSVKLNSIFTKKNISILSNKYVEYDSDNVSLMETGWEPKIDVRDWVRNISKQ